jgi:predicted NACHT family NTPase
VKNEKQEHRKKLITNQPKPNGKPFFETNFFQSANSSTTQQKVIISPDVVNSFPANSDFFARYPSGEIQYQINFEQFISNRERLENSRELCEMTEV